MRVDRITVIFKATCDCNLNCQYCYDRASREKFRGTHVTPEIVDHTAKLLSEYAENVESVISFFI